MKHWKVQVTSHIGLKFAGVAEKMQELIFFFFWNVVKDENKEFSWVKK